METMPASLLHPLDEYVDLQDGRTFRALDVTRSANGWFVNVRRHDGTEKAYYMSEPVRIVF